MNTTSKLVKKMRSMLADLSAEITADYRAALKKDPSTQRPAGTALTVLKADNGYPKNATGICYGSSGNLVVGPKIGNTTSSDQTRPANIKELRKAINALSEKRVTSLLRNVVLEAHATFPSHSTAGM